MYVKTCYLTPQDPPTTLRSQKLIRHAVLSYTFPLSFNNVTSKSNKSHHIQLTSPFVVLKCKFFHRVLYKKNPKLLLHCIVGSIRKIAGLHHPVDDDAQAQGYFKCIGAFNFLTVRTRSVLFFFAAAAATLARLFLHIYFTQITRLIAKRKKMCVYFVCRFF